MGETNLQAVVRFGRLGPWAQGVRDMRALIVIIAGFFVITWLVAELAGLEEFFRPFLYPARSLTAAVVSFILIFIGYVIYLAIVPHERHPLKRLWGLVERYCLEPRQLVRFLVPLLLLPFLMSAFTAFKSMIPEILPFYLDEALMRADRLLHGGWHPFEITHALFGATVPTLVINSFYHLWFLVMWAAVVWHLVDLSRPQRRLQFLIAFVLSWILLGSFAALLFSSAGPVYYGAVTGLADPFVPLMERLYEMDAEIRAGGGEAGLPALAVQEILWEFYINKDTTYGSGISAMPSLHVAITALIAMSAWRLHRLLGSLGWIFSALVLLGSVHLGWHYAIDGYLGIAAVAVIWRWSGRFAAREMARARSYD